MDTTNFDQIFDFVFGFAEHYLENRAGLHPFGAWLFEDLSVDGILVELGAEDDPQDKISELHDKLREQVSYGDILATGICYDVKLSKPVEIEMKMAVGIEIEAPGGISSSILVPYRYGLFNKLIFGKSIAQQTEPVVFRSTSQAQGK